MVLGPVRLVGAVGVFVGVAVLVVAAGIILVVAAVVLVVVRWSDADAWERGYYQVIRISAAVRGPEYLCIIFP